MLLQLQNIEFQYGNHAVLHGISAQINSGDFIVMTGNNGSGKTTLLRLMAGLLKPTAGHLTSRKDLRIGYLPQRRDIDRQFPITVFSLVLSGLQNRKPLLASFSPEQKERAMNVLQRVGLITAAHSTIQELSGGQFQRALLARAIVSEPDLLLLDEPDTHLDTTGREFLYQILEEQNQRSAIVLVSHDLRLPEKKLWQMNEGRLSIE